MVRRIRRPWRYNHPPLPNSPTSAFFFLRIAKKGGSTGLADFACFWVGDRVAKYAGENVHQIVRKQPAFEKGDYVKALQDGFIATDSALMDGIFFLTPIFVRKSAR
jgi:hypothetical protein